jgi:hypothetical protein
MSKQLGWLSMGLVLLAAIFGLWGCEDSTDDTSSSSGDSTASTLTVSPVAATFSASVVTTITFTASGGTASYTWSRDKTNLGSLVSAAETAIYTSTTSKGTNFITVTDAASNTVSAVVIQM